MTKTAVAWIVLVGAGSWRSSGRPEGRSGATSRRIPIRRSPGPTGAPGTRTSSENSSMGPWGLAGVRIH